MRKTRIEQMFSGSPPIAEVPPHGECLSFSRKWFCARRLAQRQTSVPKVRTSCADTHRPLGKSPAVRVDNALQSNMYLSRTPVSGRLAFVDYFFSHLVSSFFDESLAHRGSQTANDRLVDCRRRIVGAAVPPHLFPALASQGKRPCHFGGNGNPRREFGNQVSGSGKLNIN
jgi:hypothetical protein